MIGRQRVETTEVPFAEHQARSSRHQAAVRTTLTMLGDLMSNASLVRLGVIVGVDKCKEHQDRRPEAVTTAGPPRVLDGLESKPQDDHLQIDIERGCSSISKKPGLCATSISQHNCSREVDHMVKHVAHADLSFGPRGQSCGCL